MILETIGIEEPQNFPGASYNQIHKSILALGYDKSHFDLWREFAGAWNGLAHRYQACCDYSQVYITSLRQHNTAPEPKERYEQEKNIFNFFVSGFSVIECFCYGAFALCAIKYPDKFSLSSPDNKREVDYKLLLKRFRNNFPKENLTHTLEKLVNSSEFTAWSDVRNILAHRTTPPRAFRAGGANSGKTNWGAIELNEDTMTIRLHWLSETLEVLFKDMALFFQKT